AVSPVLAATSLSVISGVLLVNASKTSMPRASDVTKSGWESSRGMARLYEDPARRAQPTTGPGPRPVLRRSAFLHVARDADQFAVAGDFFRIRRGRLFKRHGLQHHAAFGFQARDDVLVQQRRSDGLVQLFLDFHGRALLHEIAGVAGEVEVGQLGNFRNAGEGVENGGVLGRRGGP